MTHGPMQTNVAADGSTVQLTDYPFLITGISDAFEYNFQCKKTCNQGINLTAILTSVKGEERGVWNMLSPPRVTAKYPLQLGTVQYKVVLRVYVSTYIWSV